MWAELIDVHGAEVMATFASSHLNGSAAVTLNRFGAGTAQYVSTQLDPVALSNLVRSACRRAGVSPVMEAPAGVEAVQRDLPGAALQRLAVGVDRGVGLLAALAEPSLKPVTEPELRVVVLDLLRSPAGAPEPVGVTDLAGPLPPITAPRSASCSPP